MTGFVGKGDFEVNEAERLKRKIAKLTRDLAKAKRDLNTTYNNRYPNGRFIICRNTRWGVAPTTFELYYEDGRTHLGLTNTPSGPTDQAMQPGVYYGSRRFGISRRTTQYDSLEKLIRAANKFGVPPELINAFDNSMHSMPKR